MNRRELTTLALVAPLAGLAPLARAQGGPIEGQHYVKLTQRQPTQDPKKLEVVEFFWYGCPHCHAFEPMLDAWVKKLPADVNFRRLPVAFREVPFVLHQKLYFAIETMGLVDSLHRKVFNAMHIERNPLNTPEAIGDFVAKNGVDKAKFLDTMNSFSVQAKSKQAAALSAGYKIDGTPAIGIDGRYYTAGSLAGSNERSLAVTEYLMAQARKAG
ncbi:thiol:disulfide interchange protein DsbA/DsbL [uncultured Methylibium sp.]|uniref:thiol:disulfide interchange protein DsbA/DsbL n=1 Tax=uncultured Methylibium sp. TaxID=381093 RepID=UPI0025E6FA16|nr:thiol:disulfide interchange protein DsbA/DsbL [uncultured Methylibium sp.]